MEAIEELLIKYKNNLFFSQMGLEIIEFEEDKVLIKLLVNENVLNLNKTIHGGVHATMIDWVFAMIVRIKTRRPCATLNLNMNYLKTASNGSVFAIGKIISQGYRLITVEGQVFDEENNILAKGIGTFKISRSK